jgi:hypothetical protein
MPSHCPGPTEWGSITQTMAETMIGSASVKTRAMRYGRFLSRGPALRGPFGAGLMARSLATRPDRRESPA